MKKQWQVTEQLWGNLLIRSHSSNPVLGHLPCISLARIRSTVTIFSHNFQWTLPCIYFNYLTIDQPWVNFTRKFSTLIWSESNYVVISFFSRGRYLSRLMNHDDPRVTNLQPEVQN